jgi:acyl dehydratase
VKSSVSLEKCFTQSDFDVFARLSGDNNPIHVDPDFAATTRFGKTVAHGALLCSVLRGLVDELVPGSTQISQSTMYPAPSPVGETLRFDVEISGGDDTRVRLDLRVTRLSDQETTCSGDTEVLR